MKYCLHKILVLSTSLGFTLFTNAQVTFEQVPDNLPAPQIIADFEGVQHSTTEFADIDGDGDQDALIFGVNNSQQTLCQLYKNDGMGNFIKVLNTNFPKSPFIFEDFDNDGDVDLYFISTESNQGKFFKNDGSGNFIEVLGTNFPALKDKSSPTSRVAFADIDGDNDRDLLITGRETTSNSKISKLYKNDGIGNFIEVTSTPFSGIEESSIAFSDIDGDSDQDLIISGRQEPTILYKNDGSGNYSEITGTMFPANRGLLMNFIDIDNDNDKDLFFYNSRISGFQSVFFKNDGSGNFEKDTLNAIGEFNFGNVAFGDIDNDNDIDMIINGSNINGERNTKAFTNNGLGLFTETAIANFNDVFRSDVSMSDVNGDNKLDILISGHYKVENPLIGTANYSITTLFINNGANEFTKIRNTPLANLHSSIVKFIDIDGDSDLDIISSGGNSNNLLPETRLFKNNGVGNYEELINSNIIGLIEPCIAVGDIDGDNDQDFFIAGGDVSLNKQSKLYINDGNGNYTESPTTIFPNALYADAKFHDIDGDNDLDFILNGAGLTEGKLYKNDGLGNFTEILSTHLNPLAFCKMELFDLDGDNDEDLLMTGTFNSHPKTYTYLNQGNGDFTFDSLSNLPVLDASDIEFADIDGDNDLDLIFSGIENDSLINRLLLNNGSGNFTEFYNFQNPIIGESNSINFTDIDLDLDLDLMITGRDKNNISKSKLYLNDGDGNYSLIENTPFKGVCFSSLYFGDIDNDNSKDILLSGFNGNLPISRRPITRLYKTIQCSSIDFSTTLNGAIIQANNTNATSYQWLDCDNGNALIANATHSVYAPTQNGNYAVEIKQGTCIDTSACVPVNNVGLTELGNQIQMTAHPNPTNDLVNLSFNENIEWLELTLQDTQGRIMTRQIYTNINQTKITLGKNIGLYLLTVKTPNNQKTIKLLKY
ncbi:MAG: T9SS type A sorting domain-containing protein [Flavobacteriales bacterium]